MKSLITLLFVCMAINLVAQDSLKAFGPIKFRMTKDELVKAVRASDNMKMVAGQVQTNILGDKYYGIPEYIGGRFCAINMSHFLGNVSAMARNYVNYSPKECEGDINDLIEFFSKQYGEPTELVGYKPVSEISLGRMMRVAAWDDGVKYVQVWETNINEIGYPTILISKKKVSDILKELGDKYKEIDKEKTKELF